jgi:glucosyl-3-phosphoglycerate synthase
MTDDSQAWPHRRTYHHAAFSPARLAAQRERTVSVCLPAREVAGTVGAIVTELVALRERGVIDEVVVVDAASDDGSAGIARAAGAEVFQEADLHPELGPVCGKGDAMWRALSVLSGELVCFLDSDTAGFGAHFACGVLGPLIGGDGVRFVKGFYRRPFRQGEVATRTGGGRVTELCARPLLNLFYPELAAVRQPLAGEIAATRELLEAIPFACGYGVEIAMLIDVLDIAGPDAIAQVDLDERQNRHQPLEALGAMACEVAQAVAVRLERDGRLDDGAASGRGRVLLPRGDALIELAAEALERPPAGTLLAR